MGQVRSTLEALSWVRLLTDPATSVENHLPSPVVFGEAICMKLLVYIQCTYIYICIYYVYVFVCSPDPVVQRKQQKATMTFGCAARLFTGEGTGRLVLESCGSSSCGSLKHPTENGSVLQLWKDLSDPKYLQALATLLIRALVF